MSILKSGFYWKQDHSSLACTTAELCGRWRASLSRAPFGKFGVGAPASLYRKSPLLAKEAENGALGDHFLSSAKERAVRIWACIVLGTSLLSPALAQKNDPSAPVVVQPGAPGAPTKTLPPTTKAVLPPPSPADVEFMQGMIMHHAQAVEMTAMIVSHTESKDLRSLGARISSSQTDEIRFMKRWLAARGQELPRPMRDMPGMDMPAMKLMPGMLIPEQMEALRKAKGAEFDRLFLEGMIQHHGGALTMVKDLFNTAGAGQDAELFDFATDADNTQRAEIRIMESMLKKDKKEEKR